MRERKKERWESENGENSRRWLNREGGRIIEMVAQCRDFVSFLKRFRIFYRDFIWFRMNSTEKKR